MEQVQKEVGEVKTALTSIDEKLAALATRNPVNEFLKNNWKLVLLILCVMLGGNAMKVVDVLLPAVTAQYTGAPAPQTSITTLPAKEQQ